MWDLWWPSGAGAGFFRVLRFPLPILIPQISPQSPSPIILGWYNRSVSGRSTQSPTAQIKKKNYLFFYLNLFKFQTHGICKKEVFSLSSTSFFSFSFLFYILAYFPYLKNDMRLMKLSVCLCISLIFSFSMRSVSYHSFSMRYVSYQWKVCN
jgi:hypothetical protein